MQAGDILGGVSPPQEILHILPALPADIWNLVGRILLRDITVPESKIRLLPTTSTFNILSRKRILYQRYFSSSKHQPYYLANGDIDWDMNYDVATRKMRTAIPFAGLMDPAWREVYAENRQESNSSESSDDDTDYNTPPEEDYDEEEEEFENTIDIVVASMHGYDIVLQKLLPEFNKTLVYINTLDVESEEYNMCTDIVFGIILRNLVTNKYLLPYMEPIVDLYVKTSSSLAGSIDPDVNSHPGINSYAIVKTIRDKNYMSREEVLSMYRPPDYLKLLAVYSDDIEMIIDVLYMYHPLASTEEINNLVRDIGITYQKDILLNDCINLFYYYHHLPAYTFSLKIYKKLISHDCAQILQAYMLQENHLVFDANIFAGRKINISRAEHLLNFIKPVSEAQFYFLLGLIEFDTTNNIVGDIFRLWLKRSPLPADKIQRYLTGIAYNNDTNFQQFRIFPNFINVEMCADPRYHQYLAYILNTWAEQDFRFGYLINIYMYYVQYYFLLNGNRINDSISPIAQNAQNVPISQNAQNVPISQNAQNAPISQNAQNAPISQNAQNDPISRISPISPIQPRLPWRFYKLIEYPYYEYSNNYVFQARPYVRLLLNSGKSKIKLLLPNSPYTVDYLFMHTCIVECDIEDIAWFQRRMKIKIVP